MNVSEAIQRRRSVRRFRPDPIPEDVLSRLLDAMRLAPSGSNRQPWRFVVVRAPEARARVAEACTWARPSGELRPQRWVAEAPVIVIGCGSPDLAAAGYLKDGEFVIADGATIRSEMGADADGYWSLLDTDLAIAFSYLELAAAAEGLGTCWIAGLNEPRLKTALGVPADWRARIVMPVGYPAESPAQRPRKPLAEIVRDDRFE